MRSALTLVAVPCLLLLLGASKPRPYSEEDKGAGFGDIAFAAGGTFVASGDGTVRRVERDALPVVVDTGRKLITLAVSEDGKQLAAVGAAARRSLPQ